MSAYITLMTPMTDEECLIAALVDHGMIRARIECSAIPLELRGWQTGRKAHIVLRKEHTGDAYNDIGFLRTNAGYSAILSNDYARFGSEWLSRIHRSYQTHFTAKQERVAAAERRRIEEERQRVIEAQRQGVLERAKKMGYHVKETREGEKIRMVLVKRSY